MFNEVTVYVNIVFVYATKVRKAEWVDRMNQKNRDSGQKTFIDTFVQEPNLTPRSGEALYSMRPRDDDRDRRSPYRSDPRDVSAQQLTNRAAARLVAITFHRKPTRFTRAHEPCPRIVVLRREVVAGRHHLSFGIGGYPGNTAAPGGSKP
jgi:hypothetical protein